jgi:uncharacterized membrane protein
VSKFYPPWLELIPLAFVAFAVIYTNIHYVELPPIFPKHFGASGMPDAWSSKSFWSVYIIPLIGVGVYIFMLVLNLLFIIRPDNPRSVVNLLDQEKDALGPERLEAIRTFTARGIWFLNTLIAALMAFLTYGSINIALGYQVGLGWVMWIFFGAIMAASFGMVIKTMMLSTPPSRKY